MKYAWTFAGILCSALALADCGEGENPGSTKPDPDGESPASAIVGPDGCPQIAGTISCGSGSPQSLYWRSENNRNVYKWGAHDFIADGVARPNLISMVTTTCGAAAVDFRTDTGNPPSTIMGACGGEPYIGTYLWTTYKIVDGSLMSQGRTGLKCQDGSDFQSFDSGDLPCR
jgi:hypothetical protein